MYRDRQMRCPRCGVDLVQYDVREKWRCRDCVGVLARGDELPIALAVDWPATLPSPRAATLGCPACSDEMKPYTVAGVDLDRCARDGYVWFDSGEMGFLRSYLEEEP